MASTQTRTRDMPLRAVDSLDCRKQLEAVSPLSPKASSVLTGSVGDETISAVIKGHQRDKGPEKPLGRP